MIPVAYSFYGNLFLDVLFEFMIGGTYHVLDQASYYPGGLAEFPRRFQ
jgi:hypothetical protein